jgi:hypothetical protein
VADAALAVFINPVRRLAAPEQVVLSDFVAGGGGLLVLGDHTDIGGSRMPLNSILEFTSIRFNFDSAVSLMPAWHGALDMLPHQVTCGIHDEVDAQIGTGASLEVGPPGFALIWGRYAFSDRGDYANEGGGGFMGNCAHDAGEVIGDVVLVAGEEVGNGRVLVFGDTSPFQNGAHFLSQRLIANSVAWLWRDVRLPQASDAGAIPAFRPFDDVALVDFGLCPRASRSPFTPRSLGGLANGLFRAGITPVPLGRSGIEHGRMEDVTCLFLVAPTRRPRAPGMRSLSDYVRSGGRLVIASGYSEPEPCEGLLDMAGLGLEPVPLGGGGAPHAPEHGNAWAIACQDGADTLVHARALGFPTIVTSRMGKGAVTLIADGEFLLDENLESESGSVPANVRFLTALFEDLREDTLGPVSTDGAVAGNHPD